MFWQVLFGRFLNLDINQVRPINANSNICFSVVANRQKHFVTPQRGVVYERCFSYVAYIQMVRVLVLATAGFVLELHRGLSVTNRLILFVFLLLDRHLKVGFGLHDLHLDLSGGHLCVLFGCRPSIRVL